MFLDAAELTPVTVVAEATLAGAHLFVRQVRQKVLVGGQLILVESIHSASVEVEAKRLEAVRVLATERVKTACLRVVRNILGRCVDFGACLLRCRTLIVL